MTNDIIDYFWKHSDKMDSCWNWTGFTDKKFTEISVRKLSLQIAGKDITERTQIKPLECQNKLCVNPDHLSLGTTQDNTRDRDQKNRTAKGEKTHSAKSTEEKVKEIRELHATGNYTNTQLSNLYGVSRNAIYKLLSDKSWNHIA